MYERKNWYGTYLTPVCTITVDIQSVSHVSRQQRKKGDVAIFKDIRIHVRSELKIEHKVFKPEY